MLHRLTEEEFNKLEGELYGKNIPFGYIAPFGAIIGDNDKIVLEADYDMLWEPYNYQAFIEGYWVYIDYDFRWKDIIIIPASKLEKEQAEYKDANFIVNLIENLTEVGML